MITCPQIRAARGLIAWNQTKLAMTAKVGLSTVKRIEAMDGPVRAIAENVWKIQRALENAGVVFIDENGGGSGVRLRTSSTR